MLQVHFCAYRVQVMEAKTGDAPVRQSCAAVKLHVPAHRHSAPWCGLRIVLVTASDFPVVPGEVRCRSKGNPVLLLRDLGSQVLELSIAMGRLLSSWANHFLGLHETGLIDLSRALADSD